MLEILFLPPIYLLVILVLGIVLGLLRDFTKTHLAEAGRIFTIFMAGQLIFRLFLNLEPSRLIGQWAYFLIFLCIIWLTEKALFYVKKT